MDDWTNKKLKEWDLPVNIIDRFKEEEIDKESLLNLTQEMLKELIPKIGLRAKIYNNILLEKQTKQQIPEVGTDMKNITSGSNNNNININEIQTFEIVDDVDENIIIYNNDNNIPMNQLTDKIIKSKEQNDVYKILIKYEEGNTILKYFEQHQILSSTLKNKMTYLIISHCLKESLTKKISTFTLAQLSESITQLFPSESKESYYIPYKKEGNKVTPNRGKLWDKYCNMRKVIRKITSVTTVTSTETNLISNIPQISSTVENENIEDDLLWLKNNINPWDTVITKWKCTFSYRYNNLIKNVNDYHTLMNEIKNPSIPGNDTIATLKLFVELFNPVNVCCKRTINNITKKNWRPSKLEIKQGFIHYINDISQLREIDDAKWAKNKLLKLTVQPYMVFVGPELGTQDRLEVSSFYVVINQNFFKLESALKAVDICFKSFFMLHLNYPTESEQIWQFIQQFFFKINTKFDKNYQFISN
ncbi:uncharacterized protein LOC112598971, partial [Melanaphis sacchari]|uniref:uncharacterized protein LOC112598971 n=1 Tax=Melanaphis sacchari TaxID=742174 RepID=UPI000DC14521